MISQESQRMKTIAAFTIALLASSITLAVRAAEIKSGPQPGDMLGAFEVTKVAGAPSDGVKVGQDLCYRCKMGNRPMVMIFSRKPDRALGTLVKKLDAVVARNKDEHNMGSFVSLIGERPEELATASKTIVQETKVQNVAFVVPKDQPNGPEEYRLNPEAETTVLIYVKGKVVASHGVAPGDLTDEKSEQILADTAKILK
jgi:hypothetical protein